MELASADRHANPDSAGPVGAAQTVDAKVERPMDAIVRLFDLVVAVTLLVLLAPVCAAIAIAIKLDSSGSPIFRQRRCGRGVREFTVLKFRTMRCDTAADPHRSYVLDVIATNGDGERDSGLQKLEDDDRVTRVGVFLRRFSLDELPQLWNVLRGEMTLVGPRPPIPYEVDFYPPHWLGRLSVKPGLTGLWQVSGRNELNYAEMVQLDLEYVSRRSLWLNTTILARTFAVVLTGRGAV
ncbi:MAG TPA: sugar transferase [Solirubrobacterales bacterium]|nr:sugar transferase [Solirubrobacterales bacterium]